MSLTTPSTFSVVKCIINKTVSTTKRFICNNTENEIGAICIIWYDLFCSEK